MGVKCTHKQFTPWNNVRKIIHKLMLNVMRNSWISSREQKNTWSRCMWKSIFSIEMIHHVCHEIKIMTRYSDSEPTLWKVLEQQAEKLFQAFAQFKCWIIHQTYLHLGKQIESHFPAKIPTNISTVKRIATRSSSTHSKYCYYWHLNESTALEKRGFALF